MKASRPEASKLARVGEATSARAVGRNPESSLNTSSADSGLAYACRSSPGPPHASDGSNPFALGRVMATDVDGDTLLRMLSANAHRT